MTKLLELAMARVQELPDVEQDKFAQWLMEEIEADNAWDRRFAESANALSQKADQAWVEHEAGGSETLDPDRI